MKKSPRQAGFTMSEMLVASALSVMLAAMVFSLLIKNLVSWHDSVARLHLSAQSRIARERILQGLQGKYGLRHAIRSQIAVTANDILFTDVSSGKPIILILATNQPPAWLDHAGTNFVVRGGVFVENCALSTEGNILNIDLTLALTSKGRKYLQPQQIRVYMLNEHGLAAPLTTLGSTFTEITSGMIQLTAQFYEKHGKYPRSWGDYAFTDLGLDPEEWRKSYNGLFYATGGSRVKVSPAEGYRMIMTDLYGKKRVLTADLNWSIWYDLPTKNWYYHSIQAINMINIDTLMVEPVQ